jgi:alginate O-acetyltransferase complex protein AlgI
MLFNTFPFLVFFAVVFTLYWSLRGGRARLVWLLVASIYFYASWNPWLITLILFSAAVDYATALLLERTQVPWRRRLLLFVSVGTNLGLLAYFKYANFFLDTVGSLQRLWGLPTRGTALNVILPLGISFYTFETISYVVDVYRGRTRAVRSLLDYALYIMFFPHLVAGPIVRPRDFLPQLRREKRFRWSRLQVGLRCFLVGLFKKAVLADHLAAVIDPVFAAPGSYGSSATWLAVLGYAAQIYCDFSGYSDMAIGLAHTLGFHLPANFHMPYFAGNIAEFWRRWHMSLSSWLRDYLFIPLGGSRGTKWQTCRNLLVTMLLGGLWHGANWTFVLWGFYHGMLLVLHRLLPSWAKPGWLVRPVLKPIAVATTFLSVCIGWVLFRSPSLAGAGTMLGRLVGTAPGLALDPLGAGTVIAILVLLLVCHVVATFVDLDRLLDGRLPAPALGTALAVLLLLILLLMPEDGKAFIYFQF